jgi:hypothetical protein
MLLQKMNAQVSAAQQRRVVFGFFFSPRLQNWMLQARSDFPKI